MATEASSRVLLVEPFYGGSHMQFMDFVANLLQTSDIAYDMVTLPGKKWHWRARTSALNMRSLIPHHNYRAIFCSSVLNLAELIALRPDLGTAFKIIYFHENQFIYPRQKAKERDFQYGYNNILSALVADKVIFNSQFNQRTFQENLSKHLRLQPDHRVTRLEDEIAEKCDVIYYPVSVKVAPNVARSYDVLHIVWPHRWEHDKDPETFFKILYKLNEYGLNFLVSVLGESYKDTMPVFNEARGRLSENIAHFGRLESKEEYFQTLSKAHVVVSTAKHEFFGVAVVESVLCGCLPLLPTGLSYDELYPKEYIYRTEDQLYKRLREFCKRPHLVPERLASTPIDMSHLHVDGVTEKLSMLLLVGNPSKK